MAAEAWLMQLGRDTLCLSVGIVAAQMLRPLLIRLGGPTLLPWRWTLPLLLMVASHLPPWAPITVLMLPPQVIQVWDGATTTHGLSMSIANVLAFLWSAGVLLVAAAHWRSHRRFVRQLALGDDGWRAPPGFNPALLGLWRAHIVLPLDFEQRFDPAERTLIIAHERVHRQRRDNWVNLLAVGICLLHWFNPLLWWALARLRQDQELACDATVLRKPDADWRSYAQALLKVQGQREPGSPFIATWRSNHPLIERIEMLKQSHGKITSTHAMWAARSVLLILGLGGSGLVMALRASPVEPPQSLNATTIIKAKDACPTMVKPEMAALPEREAPKGTSKLHATFTVAPDGKVDEIKVDGAPFFQPAIRDAISRYGCAATGQTRHVVQEFVFKLE